jgi:hypothetical protein
MAAGFAERVDKPVDAAKLVAAIRAVRGTNPPFAASVRGSSRAAGR